MHEPDAGIVHLQSEHEVAAGRHEGHVPAGRIIQVQVQVADLVRVCGLLEDGEVMAVEMLEKIHRKQNDSPECG